VSENFMGFGGIADDALLKSGEEALAIGFPLDGPVRDAALFCLKVERHAHIAMYKPQCAAFLQRVQARYPTEYEALTLSLTEHLTSRSMEIGRPPLLLLPNRVV
jgi:hypothetical protein